MKAIALLQCFVFSLVAFVALHAQESTEVTGAGSEQRLEIDLGGGVSRVERTGLDGLVSSSLRGIPPELLGLEILNEKQLEDVLIPGIYQYYGFTGTESLKFVKREEFNGDVAYLFREYINDINTQAYMEVKLEPKSNKLAMICCALVIDAGGYDTQPAISEQEAVDRVMNYLETSGYVAAYQPDTNWRASFRSEIVYVYQQQGKALQPGWLVEVPVLDAPSVGDAYGQFTVTPNGEVLRPSVWNGITILY
ncbi:MAG: hypothetical protein LBF16_11290 [Pseudomonadales bacterium]|jgi:hypothetical protein|nr:hypothetical protein [Pseudomonadales bacterium]